MAYIRQYHPRRRPRKAPHQPRGRVREAPGPRGWCGQARGSVWGCAGSLWVVGCERGGDQGVERGYYVLFERDIDVLDVEV